MRSATPGSGSRPDSSVPSSPPATPRRRKSSWLPFACLLLLLPTTTASGVAPPDILAGPVAPRSSSGDLSRKDAVPPWKTGDPVLVKGETPPEPGGPVEGELHAPKASPGPSLRTLQAKAGAGDDLSEASPSFPGIPFAGVFPPDTVGDVGPAHYVQMTNAPAGALFAVFGKDGATLAGPLPFQDLWTGGPCRNSGRGDPIVLHDQLADRWLLSQLATSDACFPGFTECHLCVAISKTPNPVSGGWNLYDFAVEGLPDYPKLAVWPDAYYLGTNQTLPAAGPGQAPGQMAGAFALEREKMLAGQPARLQGFLQPSLPGFLFQGLLPADLDGDTPPPAGAPGLFLRHRDGEFHGDPPDPSQDVLELWELDVSWVNPGLSSLQGPTRIPVADFDSDAFTVPQGGGASPIQTRNEPLMWRVAYRNGGTERLTGNFTVDAGGRAGIRWFELRKGTPQGWQVFQEGTFAPAGGHRWLGSAAMDRQGNLALGYNFADVGANVRPSLRFTGRRAGDAAGLLTQGERTLSTGAAWQVNGVWGDYAALTVDPTDGCTFWFTGERTRADGNWDTHIGAFRFESCGDSPPPPPPPPPKGCTADATTLCLNDGRFQVTTRWETRQGTAGDGMAVPLTSDTGYFWFFNTNNVEMVIKVLNACPGRNRYWVFAGGLTNVKVEIRVVDTAQGAEKVYTNPLVVPFQPLQDTDAFATCP